MLLCPTIELLFILLLLLRPIIEVRQTSVTTIFNTAIETTKERSTKAEEESDIIVDNDTTRTFHVDCCVPPSH